MIRKTTTDKKLTDKKWFDELVLELRLRQVHGSAIGDVMASARELLDDTGQEAEEAFGPARDYAAALELPAASQHGWVREALLPLVLSLLALLVFNQAVIAWAQSELMLVSPAQSILLSVPLILVAFLPLYLTAAVRRIWLLIVLVAICATAGALSGVVAPSARSDAWLALEPLPWLIGSSIVMIGLSIVATVRSGRPESNDEIIDPLSETSTGSGLGARAFSLVTSWLFPLFALGMLGLALSLR